ncbi:hypothetical protein HBN50_03045 [Halobacteriovorax sp. GB3]|uniref:hypothetical protein n=1 Tax=Halobacteriovorax sp. GB3 TaxID=2719615 RepID=UPI00235F1F6D|nr:hypothetical protein [Halobacteriovorax sp. GB3]MDD0852052.1 hypothetical protein [Halobacteriovorax sp. GB3]
MEKIGVFFLILTIVFGKVSFANDQWYDNERIMLVKTEKGFVLSDALISYHMNNRWYVPLIDFFDITGIEIKFSKEKKYAEGFIIDERDHYRIDFQECHLTFKNEIKSFPCESYVELIDEVLVDSAMLEKLLPIKFKIDSLSSSIILKTFRTLPPVARNMREDKKVSSKKTEQHFNEQPVKRDLIDGLNFGQDLKYSFKRSSANKKTSDLTHQSSISGEILTFETLGNYRGTNNKRDSWWLSFEKNDHNAKAIGNLGLSEVKIHHFNSPSLSLFGGGQKITGLYLSNQSLEESTHFTKKDFSGPLDSGWEVELYHNDVFLGRQIGSQSEQRYLFSNVDLYYGVNRFRFVFYGPKGEVRYKEDTLSIGQEFSKRGKVIYSTSMGKDKDHNDYYSFEATTNILDRFKLEAFGVHSNEYYQGIGIGTFFSGMVIDYRTLFQKEKRAMELSSKFNLFGINTNITYINNSNLKTSLLGEKNPLDYSYRLTTLIPLRFIRNLQLYSDMKKEMKVNQSSDGLSQLHRLSYSVGQFYLSGTFNIEQEKFLNEYFVRYSWNRNYIRLKNRFDEQGLVDSELGLRFVNEDKSNYSLNSIYQYDKKLLALNYRSDKRFDHFSLGHEFEVNSDKDISLGLNLSYGLTYDDQIGTKFFDRSTSEYGNIKALVFHDLNNNGKMDNSETPVEGVEVRKLAGNETRVSDKYGRSFFTFIQPKRPTDLRVSLKNVENIYLKSLEQGKRVWARAGKTAVVYFPLVVRGDLEGEVSRSDSNNLSMVKGSIVKEGIEISTFKIENDGYFFVPNVVPGDLTVKFQCDECPKRFIEKKISMPKEGDSLFIEGVHF